MFLLFENICFKIDLNSIAQKSVLECSSYALNTVMKVTITSLMLANILCAVLSVSNAYSMNMAGGNYSMATFICHD